MGVLSNPEALTWAVAAKRSGRIQTLVAGPNVVDLPSENSGILRDPAIDVVVTASAWVRDLFISIAPEMEERLVAWPVGVPVSSATGQRRFPVHPKAPWLVYDKTGLGGKDVLGAVLRELTRRGLRYHIIRCGRYRPWQYKLALLGAPAAVFISPSETQGIAQLEAWAAGVPTLVWDRGFYESTNGLLKWYGASSCPYLGAKAGMRFRSASEFREALDLFIQRLNTFAPRDYVREHFSLEAAAQTYVKLFAQNVVVTVRAQ